MTYTERTVVRDGVRLSCRDWGGTGSPVVLLHGLAGHAGEWNTIAHHLSRRHRVIALDQRGHGASERHPDDRSRAAYVADVIAVLDQLALPAPTLIGQSLGGNTALLTAAQHAHRIRALVLIEAGPERTHPDTPTTIGQWLDSWPTTFPTQEAAAAFLGGGPVGAGWAAGLEQRPDGWWPRFHRDVMIDSIADNTHHSSWQQWASITCPTLAVLGQNGIIAPDEVDRMLQQHPETLALSVPRAGHDLHLEHPDILIEALDRFLDTGQPWAGTQPT
ncbi:alpha/beta hydrolase [Streptomyces gilvifuscus]|uniref:Alpha/beta hydrolase n=1 Tax=Streptomyces gilvifuscus TaxID=1550617 RepID=A0ABT5G8V1_9ACTN|nr:alpha/beta hydrolase [Streptomyces gilvifuscus]MDC2961298.1 alpha/beta hydrolase [Streptomyces gilvifuscus]